MKFVAYTVKGLEQVAGQEIAELVPEAQITEVSDKRIVFEAGQIDVLPKLRTIDDIGILIGHTDKLESLDQVISVIRTADLQSVKQLLQSLREVGDTFSVTMSVVGAKQPGEDLLVSLSTIIGKKYGWRFTERDHSDFDVKVFVDHDSAYLSVRLTEESLYHRIYRTSPRTGSLRPTVAAAMVRLAAGNKKNLRIVDNFCGSGTILCEAFSLGHQVSGGDIDQEAIIAAQRNLANLGNKTEVDIKQQNAIKTGWPKHSFDCAISNLPWDKQIEVESITQLYIGTLQEYARIVKLQGTVCLLVSKPELLIKHIKKILPTSSIEALKISLLGQSPTIVVIAQNAA